MISPLATPLGILAVALLVFVADLAAGHESRRGAGALAFVGLTALFVATWWFPTGEAFGGVWVADAFTRYVERLLLAAGALAALAAIDHGDRQMPGRQAEYVVLLLVSLAGGALLAGAREVVTFVVSFETLSLPLYALAAMHKGSKRGVEGAIKLYVTGAISAAVTLYGVSFVVGSAGGTAFADIAATVPSPTLTLGALLAVAGMAYKLGAVPFHMWVPDTYQSAPAPFVAFLSVAPKAAGFAGIARIFTEALPHVRESVLPVLGIICALTMIWGTFGAVGQSSVRRLLAWSGVAHVGILLLTLIIGTSEALGVMLFYLAAYVASNMGAFFVVEVVGDDLSDWKGLARRSPFLGLAMLLFLLSLGGVPFVAGFWAKMFVFTTAWRAGLTGFVLLGALLAVAGLFYYLKVARAIYVEKTELPAPVVAMPMVFAIVLALAGVVGLGAWPGPAVEGALAAGLVDEGRVVGR